MIRAFEIRDVHCHFSNGQSGLCAVSHCSGSVEVSTHIPLSTIEPPSFRLDFYRIRQLNGMRTMFPSHKRAVLGTEGAIT